MDKNHYTTKRPKGQHLTKEERVIIQTRLKDGWNCNQIAREIGCSYNCIKNEIKRGTTLLYHGKVKRYKASTGQQVYENNRSNCRKKSKNLSSQVQRTSFQQILLLTALKILAVHRVRRRIFALSSAKSARKSAHFTYEDRFLAVLQISSTGFLEKYSNTGHPKSCLTENST